MLLLKNNCEYFVFNCISIFLRNFSIPDYYTAVEIAQIHQFSKSNTKIKLFHPFSLTVFDRKLIENVIFRQLISSVIWISQLLLVFLPTSLVKFGSPKTRKHTQATASGVVGGTRAMNPHFCTFVRQRSLRCDHTSFFYLMLYNGDYLIHLSSLGRFRTRV